MTATTDDPVVAVVYGALAYPSQRPSLTTSVDLIAGQPGPWTLEDVDRARLAEDLVDRIRGGRRPEPVEVMAEAVTGSVIDAIDAAKRLLGQQWAAHHAAWDPHVLHQVESLEARMVDFLTQFADGLPVPDPPVAVPVFPSIAEATDYRPDQWMVLLRQHRISQRAALRDLREAAEAAGRTPPSALRDVTGRRDLAELLLQIVVDHGLNTTGGA